MLVTAATFADAPEAHLVRGRLEAEGIPAHVAFDGHVTLDWPLSLALGGVAVQVSASDLDAAREILRAHAAGEFAIVEHTREDEPLPSAEAQQAAARPPACSHCGSEDVVRRVSFGQKVLAVAVFLFGGAVFPTRSGLWRCRHCYNYWPVDA